LISQEVLLVAGTYELTNPITFINDFLNVIKFIE